MFKLAIFIVALAVTTEATPVACDVTCCAGTMTQDGTCQNAAVGNAFQIHHNTPNAPGSYDTITHECYEDTNHVNKCTCSCETTTPTCSDNTQNGDETGVDCGGSCSACVPAWIWSQELITLGDTTNTSCTDECQSKSMTCNEEVFETALLALYDGNNLINNTLLSIAMNGALMPASGPVADLENINGTHCIGDTLITPGAYGFVTYWTDHDPSYQQTETHNCFAPVHFAPAFYNLCTERFTKTSEYSSNATHTYDQHALCYCSTS